MPAQPDDGHAYVVGRCDEHDCVAELFDDGSVTCLYLLVVEMYGECRWVPLPPEWTQPFGAGVGS